jgi:hypothetical protein
MHRRIVAILILVAMFSAGCADSSSPASPTSVPPAPSVALTGNTTIEPGDKIGTMVLTRGRKADERSVFFSCRASGDQTCVVQSADRLVLGDGWAASDQAHLDANWKAMNWELYLDGRQVDLSAFGTIDTDISATDASGNAVTDRLRAWDVVAENVTPGKHTVRRVTRVLQEINDGFDTYKPGTGDVDQVLNFVVQ